MASTDGGNNNTSNETKQDTKNIKANVEDKADRDERTSKEQKDPSKKNVPMGIEANASRGEPGRTDSGGGAWEKKGDSGQRRGEDRGNEKEGDKGKGMGPHGEDKQAGKIAPVNVPQGIQAGGERRGGKEGAEMHKRPEGND